MNVGNAPTATSQSPPQIGIAPTPPDLRATHLSWNAKLFVSPTAHRLMPDRVVVALTVLFARLQWRLDGRRREAALRNASKLLADTPRSEEVEQHARQLLIETALREVLIWRPWMLRNARVIHPERLDDALAKGNGAIVMTAHLGANSMGQTSTLLGRDYRVSLFTGHWLSIDNYLGFGGHRALTLKRRAEEHGARWVTSPGAFATFESLLRQNEIASIPFDVSGGHETTFVGKPAWLRTGIAGLGLATGAQIVPAFAGRHRHRLYLRFAEPIDPAAFDGLDELMAHLANVVGEEILSRPGERQAIDYLMQIWDGPLS